jgi:hypothetical protein
MVIGYLAFMDHSITEQLTGRADAWHTTVIALSEGGEVSNLANRIAQGIFPAKPHLRKWSDGRGASKQRYHEAFSRELARHLPLAKVYLLATSATETTITKNREQLLQELGMADISQEIIRPSGRVVLRVGPFVHKELGTDHYFELPLNRAIMIVWIAHFVSRMHRMLRLQLQNAQPEPVIVDWFFYHDKFAGDSPDTSPATSFFQTLVSGNISNGNVRSGFFVQSDTVDADLLADNLAGLINNSCETNNRSQDLLSILNSGCVYYETS